MNEDKAVVYARRWRALWLWDVGTEIGEREAYEMAIESAYRAGHAQGVADANRKEPKDGL